MEGRLTTRSYDDKDGNKRWITEVVADDVLLLGGRGEGGGDGGEEYGQPVSMPRSARPSGSAPSRPSGGGGGFEPGITDDDVPF